MLATMQIPEPAEVHAESSTARYARCIKASKRVRWDIDAT